ncbi:MAG: acyl-CoA synthetase [Planctomycetota bacterium]|nr:MAG: acyl-CoA synthetase [Planctomycetota bacterium]
MATRKKAVKKRSKGKSSSAKKSPAPPVLDPAHALDGLFRPRSIAVVGASRRKGSIGHEIVAKLVQGGFSGPVCPINPQAESVLSIRCYASIEEVPGEVDMALLVVPASAVNSAAEACGKKGVRGLVVITAGFREIGGEGLGREAELQAIAKRYGMRIIGPNCMGIVNTELQTSMNASFAASTPIPGRIAFVSQSGALGEAILADASNRGLGIHMFASIGNHADVGVADLMEYWEADDGVELILLYMEAFGDPQRFKAVAERLRGKKPIIAVKSGRSTAGARAAGSHTGSVAGEDRAIDTFLSQCGVLRANSMREMFDYAEALLDQPLPQGRRIAVVTNAGGPGILATDAFSGAGFELTELSEATRKRLDAVMPPEATSTNPVDLIASADGDRYRKVLRIVMRDKSVDSLLVLFVSPTMIDASKVAEAIVDETKGSGKPVLACVMGKRGEEEAVSHLKANGVPVFRFPEEAAITLAAMSSYTELTRMPVGEFKVWDVDRKEVDRVFAEHAKVGGEWLTTSLVQRLLRAYGFPTIPSHEVGTVAEAAEKAFELGYPVVLKAMSSKLVHKSDMGGVVVGLDSGDAVLKAAGEMRKKLGRRCKDLRFEVQGMAQGHRELLLGFKRTEGLGPLIAVGFGGTHVEVLRDVVVRVGPLHDLQPGRMLDALRAAPLLGAYRGEPAIDRKLVEECVLRLDQLARELPQIEEMDVNPFIVDREGGSSYVVDARVRLRDLAADDLAANKGGVDPVGH